MDTNPQGFRRAAADRGLFGIVNGCSFYHLVPNTGVRIRRFILKDIIPQKENTIQKKGVIKMSKHEKPLFHPVGVEKQIFNMRYCFRNSSEGETASLKPQCSICPKAFE